MDLSTQIFDLRDAIEELREERAELLKRIETLAARVDEVFRTQQPAEAKPLEDLAEADHREDVQQDEPPSIDGLDTASAMKEFPSLIGNPKADIERDDRSEEVLPRLHSGILPRGGTR